MRMAAYDMSQLEPNTNVVLPLEVISSTVTPSTKRKPLPPTSFFADNPSTSHRHEDVAAGTGQQDRRTQAYSTPKTYGNNIISGSASVHQGDVYLTNYYTYQNNNTSMLPNTTNEEAQVVEQETIKKDARGFAFEELLMNSRAYRNAAHNNAEAFSIMNSAGRTATWSMLSGLSLSEMSNIAILAIPIYATDLNDKEGYDFEPPRTEATTNEAYQAESPSQNPNTKRPKRSLKSWWKQRQSQNLEEIDVQDNINANGVFDVPLSHSIVYANVAISLTNEEGEMFIHGYVPIIVAKVGVFLKEKGK